MIFPPHAERRGFLLRFEGTFRADEGGKSIFLPLGIPPKHEKAFRGLSAFRRDEKKYLCSILLLTVVGGVICIVNFTRNCGTSLCVRECEMSAMCSVGVAIVEIIPHFSGKGKWEKSRDSYACTGRASFCAICCTCERGRSATSAIFSGDKLPTRKSFSASSA